MQKKIKPPKQNKKSKREEHAEIVSAADDAMPLQKVFNKSALGWLVFLLGVLLYSNTFNHDYTVDDITVISGNRITQQGVSAIPELLTTPYRIGYWQRKENLYRPLSMVMFAIEYEIAPASPALSHMVNVLVYGLTGWLLYLLLLQLFAGNALIALVCAVLFIAHPIHTEVVANIKSRDELLSLFFCLGALFNLFKYLASNKMGWMLLALSSYMLALFSKENAVTFMAVIPLAIYFFSSEKIKRIVSLTLLFLIPVAVYFSCRFVVLKDLGAYDEVMLINNSLVGADSFGGRLATALGVLGKYMMLLLLPLTLVSDYSYNQIPVVGWDNVGVLLSVATLAAMTIFALMQLKKRTVFSFSVLYFFITLSVVANVLFLIESAMGERFVYMPSVGFAMVTGFLLVSFLAEKNQTMYASLSDMINKNTKLFAVVGIVFALYAFKTVTRNVDWKNNLTLLEADVKNSPNSAREQYAYGSATVVERAWDEPSPQKRDQLLQKGINHLQKAVEIWPEYADAYNMLGKAYMKLEDATSAAYTFDKAQSIKTFSDAAFYSDASLAYFSAKQYDKAIVAMQKSVAIDPLPEGWSNLGMYMTESGKPVEAIAPLQKAIALKPDFAKAHYNLGLAFARLQNFDQAIVHFEKALELSPTSEENLNNLGNCYAAKQDYAKALDYFLRVEKLNPGNVMVLKNIGFTYRNLGNHAKAEEYITRAGGL